MKVEQLLHLLRASAEIVDDNQFIVIGSQSILGKFPQAPADLLWSVEADMYAKNKPQKTEKLNSIGDMSQFHITHGVYVDPVDKTTAILAKGWQGRLVNIETHGKTEGQRVTGLCLNPDDLFVSKVAAYREKDIDFVKSMIKHGMVSIERVKLLATDVANPINDLELSKRIVQRIDRLFAEVPEDERTLINIANGKYTGHIVGMSDAVVQQLTVGEEDYIIHHISQLTPPLPAQGDLCTVTYKGGRATVFIHGKGAAGEVPGPPGGA